MGSSRSVRGWIAVVGFVFTSFAPPARADESEASIRMAARELALTGADAFDKKDYATALDRFQRAESLYRAPSISVMVARCLARVGRVVEAVDKYEETRRVPLEANAPEAFQRAVADANAEVEAVQARVARLQLRLPPDAPPGTQIMVDDKPLPRALLGVDVPIDPGAHRVAARAEGRTPFARELTVTEGGREEIDVLLLPREAEPAASRPTDASRDSSGDHASTWGIVLLSGGGVALAAGAITGIVALGHKSELDASCHPGCPPSMRGDLDAYRLNRTLSVASFGVGLAAAGTGTYLLLHRGRSGGELAARVWPGGASLTGRF